MLTSLSLMYQCAMNEKKETNMNAEADSLIKNFEAKVKPLYKEMSLAYWNASITGNEADYQKSLEAEMAVNSRYYFFCSNKKSTRIETNYRHFNSTSNRNNI